MLPEEFDNQFDVLYNNITSNQAPGLNTYEKSVFLTKAEKEIVKNYFSATSKGNNLGQGFDDSAKRQADFSSLMMTKVCFQITSSQVIGYVSKDSNGIALICMNYDKSLMTTRPLSGGGGELTPVDGDWTWADDVPDGTYDVKPWGSQFAITIGGDNYIFGNFPYHTAPVSNKLNSNSQVFAFPPSVFIPINETAITDKGVNLQIVPLRYDEYLRLMSKPFKRPVKYQAWRLINNGTGNQRNVELVCGPNDTISTYTIRYIRTPKPIILGSLDGLTIDGYRYSSDDGPNTATIWSGGCELDPILHEEILQRAVELAKIAWTATGQDSLQPMMQAGQRSE